jgi:hypothetical protein
LLHGCVLRLIALSCGLIYAHREHCPEPRCGTPNCYYSNNQPPTHTVCDPIAASQHEGALGIARGFRQLSSEECCEEYNL